MSDEKVREKRTVAAVKPEPKKYDKKKDGVKTGEVGYIYYVVFADGSEAQSFGEDAWNACKQLIGKEQEFVFSVRDWQGTKSYTIDEIPGVWSRPGGGRKPGGGGGWKQRDPESEHLERMSIEAQVAAKIVQDWGSAIVAAGGGSKDLVSFAEGAIPRLHKAIRDSAASYRYQAPAPPSQGAPGNAQERPTAPQTAAQGNTTGAPQGEDLVSARNAALSKFSSPRKVEAAWQAAFPTDTRFSFQEMSAQDLNDLLAKQ